MKKFIFLFAFILPVVSGAQHLPAGIFGVAILQYPDYRQFEKIEMGVNLPANLQAQVNEFIDSDYKAGLNPFNPDDISVEADFSNGGKHYLVYGFYFEDFERDPQSVGPRNASVDPPAANWIQKPTEYPFRIRFAPPQTGKWECIVSIRVKGAKTEFVWPPIILDVEKSGNKGWLEVGNDRWHLRYSGTKESFFALAQNIAWNDNSVFRGAYKPPFFHPGGFLDIQNYVQDLAENNGNLVRIVVTPWSFEFELEHLNNYYDRLENAWEFDQLVQQCEKNNMKLFVCLEYGKYHTSPNEGWTVNPYHREIPGIKTVDDFLTDSTAIAIYKKKLRYFLARWGYSTSLGVTELASEFDGWSYAASEGDAQFRKNEAAQKKQVYWHNQIFSYIKSTVAYRPMLTSTSYGVLSGYEALPSPFSLDNLDITNRHAYYAERQSNIFRFADFNAPRKGTHALWPDKPTCFGECGLSRISRDPVDIGDAEGCNDVNFHNMLWSTSMMGGVGTGFAWWQWFNNEYREATYPALFAFYHDIDFERTDYVHPGFWDDASPLDGNHSNSEVEVFYNTSGDKLRFMGWAHNTSYWWGNTIENCVDRSGFKQRLPADDDPEKTPRELSPKKKFEIHGLLNNYKYTLEFHKTRTLGGIAATKNYETNIFGTLKAAWIPGDADWAVKGYPAGSDFEVSSVAGPDTLNFDERIVHAEGNHIRDVNKNMHYHWDFGNGQVSDLRNATVVYGAPGTYLVTLVVTDGNGLTDTLRQYVVVIGEPEARVPEYFNSKESVPDLY
jgi:hypothetical protein